MKRIAVGVAGACWAAICGVAFAENVRIGRPGAASDVIRCEGAYGGHLQGVATDERHIYWSFTVQVVKTDLAGHVQKSIDVPSHHGDLCVKGGIVYVAVNFGKFNHEDNGDSWVYAYAADDLRPAGKWRLPMCVHGAGGMTWADDRFFVVGGLPATHECNYVYEFTSDFRLVKRHDLKTGFTLMGIQTAAFEEGRFLFGIYGCRGNPSGTLDCPRDLSSFVRRKGPGDVGILRLQGSYWTGRTRRSAQGANEGDLVRVPGFPNSQADAKPVRTGRGTVRIFYEQEDEKGWVDSGYRLVANGYHPLCNADPKLGVFFSPAELTRPNAVVRAVGIGAGCAYSEPDLVRAVRRVAETGEAFAIRVVGTRESVKNDRKLKSAIEAVRAEAVALGVAVR